uniref:Reverse transcriptase domain-containing protein n=1 Tax=Tanacetum cinerariifolium TaxID=118510 RepID=A0A6L2M6S2_TANCI|nr:reverse transcriptase domain-containing protein [Tanacetum cinerariifolium]
MRTRNSYFLNNSSATIPRRRSKRRTPNIVEPELCTIVEMADNRTIEELLQAPTKGEAWERFKEMLRACPHHGFTELAQIDTFYTGLNDNDQDSLNAAAGGNLLSKTTREALENASKSDDWIDKLADQISTLVDIFAKKIVTPASVKAVEDYCVTCGGNHANYNCPNTDSNQPSVFAATDLYFGISFADALILMPKFASTIKSLLTNKDKLFELAKISLNENCSAMLLKKLLKNLGDPYKFLIPCDSPGMDEILGFSNNSSDGNPTSNFEPILSDSSPSLTPFEGSDFILEEIDAYLKDELILPKIDHADCEPEGDICLHEKLLNDDPFQLPLMDLKQGEVVKEKSLIEEPPELELKELPSHLEYAYLECADKLPVIISKDLKVDEKKLS